MPLLLLAILTEAFGQQGTEILGSCREIDTVEVEHTCNGYPILAGLVKEAYGEVLKTDTQTTEILVWVTHGDCRNACFVG